MKIEKKNSKKTKEILKVIEKKNIPLFGNNRSFSCVATKRTWGCNKQKVKINGKTYQLSPKTFKKISKQLDLKV
jgi:ribosomal protein L28